jgi:hypothetical protein
MNPLDLGRRRLMTGLALRERERERERENQAK